MQYSWAPATYLDDPASPNPIFTPPATGNGTIAYTLTMTPLCGGFLDISSFPPSFETIAELTYNVQYYATPDPIPSFTVNNFNYDQCQAEFNIDLNPNTSSISVEITNTQSGALWYSNIFNVNTNNCCNFGWTSSSLPDNLWDSFESCDDYNIKIKTNNICNESVYTEQNLNWDQETNYQLLTPLGNIITPATTPGVNDWFLINANGVDHTQIYIYDRNGAPVYQKSNASYCEDSQSGKLWAGQCNTGLCSQSCLQEDYYYYVLFVNTCDGQTVDKSNPQMDSVAYQIFLSNNPDLTKKTKLSASQNYSLFPNPSNGQFTTAIDEAVYHTVRSYQIFEYTGKMIYEKTSNIKREELIDLNLAAGVYTFVLQLDDGQETKRFVIY
jgi:hypothetical protein